MTPWASDPTSIVAEPCAGDGDLVRHLESFGLRCVWQGDIRTGQDALDLTPADINGVPVVTNPPFSRESQLLLRRMIAHFLQITSTVWLLLPADFASNQWFAPFLPACSAIIAVGRVKWIAGMKGNSTARTFYAVQESGRESRGRETPDRSCAGRPRRAVFRVGP